MSNIEDAMAYIDTIIGEYKPKANLSQEIQDKFKPHTSTQEKLENFEWLHKYDE